MPLAPAHPATQLTARAPSPREGAALRDMGVPVVVDGCIPAVVGLHGGLRLLVRENLDAVGITRLHALLAEVELDLDGDRQHKAPLDLTEDPLSEVRVL